jgi:hypothetical protein
MRSIPLEECDDPAAGSGGVAIDGHENHHDDQQGGKTGEHEVHPARIWT